MRQSGPYIRQSGACETVRTLRAYGSPERAASTVMYETVRATCKTVRHR